MHMLTAGIPFLFVVQMQAVPQQKQTSRGSAKAANVSAETVLTAVELAEGKFRLLLEQAQRSVNHAEKELASGLSRLVRVIVDTYKVSVPFILTQRLLCIAQDLWCDMFKILERLERGGLTSAQMFERVQQVLQGLPAVHKIPAVDPVLEQPVAPAPAAPAPTPVPAPAPVEAPQPRRTRSSAPVAEEKAAPVVAPLAAAPVSAAAVETGARLLHKNTWQLVMGDPKRACGWSSDTVETMTRVLGALQKVTYALLD